MRLAVSFISIPARRLLTLSLLLGATTAWMAAWWISWRVEFPDWRPTAGVGAFVRPDCPTMQFASRRQSGKVKLWVHVGGLHEEAGAPSKMPPHWSEARRVSLGGTFSTGDTVRKQGIWREAASGWPALCLRWFYTDLEGVKPHYAFASPRWLRRTLPGAPRGALPYRPWWPGLILNTLFYALLWVPLMLVPFVLRHYLRLRRGRCPLCCYNLRHTMEPGCPECGWKRGRSQEVD